MTVFVEIKLYNLVTGQQSSCSEEFASDTVYDVITWKRFSHWRLFIMVTSNMDLISFFQIILNKLLDNQLNYRWIETLSQACGNTVKAQEKLKSKMTSSSHPYKWHTYSLREIYHEVRVWWQAPGSNFLHHYFPWPRELVKWLCIGCTLGWN